MGKKTSHHPPLAYLLGLLKEHLRASMLTPNIHIFHTHVSNWVTPSGTCKVSPWLPSKDEDVCLLLMLKYSITFQKKKKKKKGRNLVSTDLSLHLFGQISLARGLSLLCDHTRCYTMKPALDWNPSQLQSKYKWQKTHHLPVFFFIREKVGCFQIEHGTSPGRRQGRVTRNGFKL